jgi:ribonuclease-3
VPLSVDRRRQLLDFLDSLELSAVLGPDPELDPLDEALTHTSAGLARNHERLEFLGDAVLRLAAAEFLERDHPSMDVGSRSALRAQLVSDRWLAELGEACGIEQVLRLGATATGDAAGRRTIRAEAVEALIGGLYQACGSLAPVHAWLTPHWRRSAAEWLTDPHRHNWKTALQEWSQAEGLGLPHYRSEEASRRHGDPRRFRSWVSVGESVLGEGWGGSRREAEQQAARVALESSHGTSSPASRRPGNPTDG